MSKTLTIALEDEHLLREICGVNDTVSAAIQDSIGEDVYARGNELILGSGDKEKQELFKALVQQLVEHYNEGHNPDPELVKTLYRSLTEKGADARLLKDSHINIPKSLKVFPRNQNQADYIKGMFGNDIVFGVGPAGTGKTYLAIAHALKEILERKKKKLVLTRPVVEAGESLGFLPGDLLQKISPYLRPLYDAMDSLLPYSAITKLEESRIIEVAPLAYMRGRSLKNSYIILDEAQNTTKEQMKMFLTRLGEGSKAIITGDVTQIDLPKSRDSGLIHAVEILKNIEGIHFTFFSSKDVVRNPLVKSIVDAYEREEKKHKQ